MTSMTTVHVDGPTPPQPPPPVSRKGAWRLTWHGIRTVAQLELRQRVRSTRWIVALVAWFVVVGGLTLLITGVLDSSGVDRRGGQLLFGAVTFLVLGLGLLVTPTLASTAINGDRSAGTLATLQVTLLSPAEIALGKLLAAWAAACAFLLISLPFLLLALSMGGTPAASLVRVVVLIALLLAAICGIGLGYSALVSRAAGSTVLTFVTVSALALLTPALFGLTYMSITQTERVQVWGVPSYDYSGAVDCELYTEERSVSHTERTWWLLGINPFVVVADGAGTRRADPYDDYSGGTEPLGSIRDGVRGLRQPDSVIDECYFYGGERFPASNGDDAPIWPWGLAANLALGAAGVVVAVRRLTIPSRKLARGTRVA
jgi:ABC-type transport system involved in multi-copper enzyme maturation permease subunit